VNTYTVIQNGRGFAILVVTPSGHRITLQGYNTKEDAEAALNRHLARLRAVGVSKPKPA